MRFTFNVIPVYGHFMQFVSLISCPIEPVTWLNGSRFSRPFIFSYQSYLLDSVAVCDGLAWHSSFLSHINQPAVPLLIFDLCLFLITSDSCPDLSGHWDTLTFWVRTVWYPAQFAQSKCSVTRNCCSHTIEFLQFFEISQHSSGNNLFRC